MRQGIVQSKLDCILFVRAPHSRSKARWDYRAYYPVAIILKIRLIVDISLFGARSPIMKQERNYKASNSNKIIFDVWGIGQTWLLKIKFLRYLKKILKIIIILYNFLMIVYQSIIYFMLDCIHFFNDKK